MRIAILDLGTNTFHLLIADVAGKKYEKVYKSKIAVKLGEGAIHKNRIASVPFRRGIDTLKKYKEVINQHQPEKVFAFATSAIRSSVNGDKFVLAARKEAGINIKVISGLKEAELICFGVRQCVRMNNTPSLIMDIGGGSTEFIIADDHKIYWKKSFDIGAARLLEMFKPTDPVTENEISEIENFLGRKLLPLKNALKKFPVNRMIGSSGSFDTFAEMAGYRYYRRNVVKDVNAYKFKMTDFYKLHEVILKSTLEQRRKMKGLIEMRVDMIVISSICTNFILKSFGMKEMYLSKFALKEGALWSVINRKN